MGDIAVDSEKLQIFSIAKLSDHLTYLHEFDCWVINDLAKKYPLRYVRYADDFIILLKQKELIYLVHHEVAQKLQDIKLQLHTDESKTKYVDISQEFLEFVGFQFTLEYIKIKPANILKFQERIVKKINKEPSYKTGQDFKHRFNFFIKYVIDHTKLDICIVDSEV